MCESERPGSIVAEDAFAPLVALLRLERQGRDRAGLEPLERDRLPGLLAIAVGSVVEPLQGGFDLGDQLALAVARTQLDGAIGFRRRAVGEIGMILILVLQVLQRFPRLLEDLLLPGDEPLAEILPLAVAHERLFLRRPVILVLFRRHLTATPCPESAGVSPRLVWEGAYIERL